MILRFFFFRRFTQPENPLNASRVGRKGFFHEHVHALRNRILQMRGTKGRVRGQQDDIAGAQAVDRVSVSIEAEKAPVRRHVHERTILRAEGVMGAVELALDEVGHCGEFRRPARGLERIGHGAGAASAATDERQADGVVIARVNPGNRHAGQCGSAGELPALREKLAAGGFRGRHLC